MSQHRRNNAAIANQIAVVLGIITDNQGRVYMAQRNDPGTNEHGFWEFPGGKIEFGEDPETALKRELAEETGFETEVLRLLPKIYQTVYQKNPENTKDKLQVILLCYQCRYISGKLVSGTPEVIKGKFFKKNAVDYEKSLPWTKEIIAMLN